MMKQGKTMVSLKTKAAKNAVNQTFEISQANKLLNLPNSQWKLDDKGFKWNGTEIAKDAKK